MANIADDDWCTGAVAIVDALGVQGIGRSGSYSAAAAVLRDAAAKGRALKAVLERDAGHQYPFKGVPKTDVVPFADTILIATSIPGDHSSRQLARDMLWRVGIVVGYVVRHAAQLSPPLVYRGAIALGRLWRDEVEPPDFPVIQGPAVNAAAKEYEIARAGVIHVVNPPVPLGRRSGWLGSPELDAMFVDCSFPTKDGDRHGKVLSPFFHVTSDSDEGRAISTGFDGATCGHSYNGATMDFIAECARIDRTRFDQ